MGEQTNKSWHKYYSAIKKNEPWIHAATWMSLTNITLNDDSMFYMITYLGTDYSIDHTQILVSSNPET